MRPLLLLAAVSLGLLTAHSTAIGQTPGDTSFFGIVPNPANDRVVFVIYIPDRGGILEIVAYDAIGRRIATIVRRDWTIGTGGHFPIVFNGNDTDGNRLPCGFHLIIATINGTIVATGKFVYGCSLR